MNDKEITLKEAETDAGVTAATLRHHAEKGNLRARKIGHLWVTTKQAIEEWKETAHRNPNMTRNEAEGG